MVGRVSPLRAVPLAETGAQRTDEPYLPVHELPLRQNSPGECTLAKKPKNRQYSITVPRGQGILKLRQLYLTTCDRN